MHLAELDRIEPAERPKLKEQAAADLAAENEACDALIAARQPPRRRATSSLDLRLYALVMAECADHLRMLA